MNNLLWYSQVHANTGTASFCRNQCLSLKKLNYFDTIEIRPDPLVPTKVDNPIIQSMIKTDIDARDKTIIQVMWPERWLATIAEKPKYFIGYNAIEGTKISYKWIKVMQDDDVDLILAMSKPMKEMFVRNNVPSAKIFALGHGINPELFKAPLEQRSNRPYTFIYLNGWRTSIGRKDRKGPEILLDAWVNGKFLNDERVHLYMKVNMAYEQKRDYFADIKKHLGYDLNIWKNFTWDVTNYPDEALPGVYHKGDVFVAPTKGEGFGITIAEAMGCGLPVIVPFNLFSGHMDFCYPNKNPKAIFIKIDRAEEVDSRLMGYLYSGSNWHIPSTDDLIEKMWWCFNNRKKAKKIGEAGRKEIHENWTWDAASHRLVEELKRRGMYV
jgi:glycosyltransferase involved in cell wall biosynthesis